MDSKKQYGIIQGLYRYPQKKMPAVSETELVLNADGIAGDHHADGGERQISLVTSEEKKWMDQQELKGFCFKKYKENILLEGVSLSGCKAGDEVHCEGVILELTGSIKSCHSDLCRLAEKDGVCILADSSRFAKVKRGGNIKLGMKVTLKSQNEP